MLETEWFEGKQVGDEGGGDALRSVVDLVLCALILGLLGLAGCAQGARSVVQCPTPTAVLVQDRAGKPYLAFDAENLSALRSSIEMRARGECVDSEESGAQGTEL